jgi:hypothetical protein
MENSCIFVSSRGIAKNCSFYPNNIISDKSDNISYLYNLLKSKMFDGMSIYVISNSLNFFVNSILPFIRNKFILVSGASVKTCPIEALSKIQFEKLMTNQFLIKWCSQNNSISHLSKILQIPLGIDYHTISSNKNHKWREQNEGILPIEQESILQRISVNSKPFYERNINKIYINFAITADRFNQRQLSLNQIPKNLLDKCESNKRSKTWKIMTDYAFVLSPYGNGMDCHRHWESIILGCIPIIKSKEFHVLFNDLPVLIVNEWSDINEQLLINTIEEFKNKTFNMEKVKLEYWKNKIFSM